MSLTMPVVEISFRDVNDVSNLNNGKSVALILESTSAGTPAKNPLIVKEVGDIPTSVSAANKTQIVNALIGATNKPSKVVCYFKVTTETDYTNAKAALEKETWDWLAIPGIAAADVASITTWIGDLRDDDIFVKAVLPMAASDKEYIVNFATDDIVVGSETYTTAQYCSRIAGLLAGTPLTESATYTQLTEVTDCERFSKADMDTAVAAGKFIIFHDGAKVKTGRGVNSLITGTSDDMRKIKIIDVMDSIRIDLKKVVEDQFIGRYQNTYDNKVVLLAALGEYFDKLVMDGVIAKKYEKGIDISAQTQYLREKGVDTTGMTEQKIIEADTGSNVYFYAKVKIADAIEDIYIAIQD